MFGDMPEIWLAIGGYVGVAIAIVKLVKRFKRKPIVVRVR